MAKTLRAIFDGDVLRPEGAVDLQPNTWYVVTIEREEGEKAAEETYPLSQILTFATDMGVTDLSTRHHWYAHGGLEMDKRSEASALRIVRSAELARISGEPAFTNP